MEHPRHRTTCFHEPDPPRTICDACLAHRQVRPGERLKLVDPRFGSPEHLKALWTEAELHGPFFIEDTELGFYVRECHGRRIVAHCLSRAVTVAIMCALETFETEARRVP